VPEHINELRSLKQQLYDRIVSNNKYFYQIYEMQTEITELFYQMKVLQIEERYKVCENIREK
jgi:hypothetical protein